MVGGGEAVFLSEVAISKVSSPENNPMPTGMPSISMIFTESPKEGIKIEGGLSEKRRRRTWKEEEDSVGRGRGLGGERIGLARMSRRNVLATRCEYVQTKS